MPLLDMPWISEIKWNRIALKSRLHNPKIYENLGKDVSAVIRRLEAWLAKNDPEYTEWRATV